MEITEHKLKIPPDYQYAALHHGNIFQQQWHRNRLNLIENIHFLSSSDNVADVGCGSGNVVLHFASSVASMVGFDYNKEGIDFLEDKIKKRNIVNASVFQWNILNDPPREFYGFFDKIILNEVIEHFDYGEIEKIMSNLKKLLKREGDMLITTPNYQASMWPVMEYVVDKFKIFPTLWGEQHKIKFSKNLLRKICKKEKLTEVSIGSFGHISPFMIVFGRKIADAVAKVEMKYITCCGPQLFIVCRKDHE